MKKNATLFVCLMALLPIFASGQGSTEYDSGLKLNINNNPDYFIRFLTWHQVWVRYNNNNTGSIKQSNPVNNTLDVGLRRSRFLMYAQLNNRFLILTHFGINNQNSFSGGVIPTEDGKKPQLFMHDAYVEYQVIEKYLSMGAGLHYWNGISRMANASTLNFLAMDAPIFNWPTIERTDQFARMMGVYAKGKINKIDYRVAVNEPFKTNGTPNTNEADYSPRNINLVYQGYACYNFLEEESNLLPYYVGTYLGSKRVFNLGAGFLQNKDAMWSTTASGDTAFHNMMLWAVDAFLDMPLNKEKKTAITAYAAYHNYNFGPNNVRNLGIMNSADGGGSLRGNAIPLVGTGDIIYIQSGYLLSPLKNGSQFQPYAAYTHSLFEGVKNAKGENVPVSMLELGCNYYITGHHAKLTLNYRNRPDFTNPNALKYRPEVTLQAMIYL